AANGSGEGPRSVEVSTTPAVAVPQSAPANFQATAGSTQVGLSWSAVTGATSYNVYRSTTSGGEGSTPYRSGITSTSFSDTGLTNGTTCRSHVVAANGSGEGPRSGEVSATPRVPPPQSAPANVQATAGNAQVSLSWSAVAGATSYNLYRST